MNVFEKFVRQNYLTKKTSIAYSKMSLLVIKIMSMQVMTLKKTSLNWWIIVSMLKKRKT